jgi:sugar lactone lactonase YvrE
MKEIKVLFLQIFFVTACIAQAQRIEFKAPLTYPEGIVYDYKTDVFYVSSVHHATIGKVDRKGNYSAFYSDSTLKSTYGMKIDPSANRLWVCAGDANYSQYKDAATHKKMIKVVALELSTGNKLKEIDLSSLQEGQHFANDMALDNKGNVYITDSYSPVIYRVDNSNTPSVFAKNNWFMSVGVGLNGIAWHPNGFLVVANNGSGCLLKVDLSDPSRVSKVQIDQFFPGADGLLFDDQDNLVLVQNKGTNKIFKLSSNDNWSSAKVIGATPAKDMFSYPSTATAAGKEIWVMNSKLNELADSTKVFSSKFSLQKAMFLPVK